MKIMINKILFFSLFLCFTLSLYAHQTALSYLEIRQKSDKSVNVILKKPLADINSDDIKISLPKNCKSTLTKSIYDVEGYIVFDETLYCGKRGLEESIVWIENLLATDKGVVFYYKSDDFNISNRLLTADNPFITIKKPKTKISSVSYLKLGIEHILKGVDHLLFVLALLLLVSNIKTLILTITSFTIAHSISLALAVLGYLNLNVLYIESMIALSIVFVARETIVKSGEKTLSQTYPWLIAFLFGLLHGLGFANALFEIGVLKENITASLIFFNIGVEIGQLIFIATTILSAKIFNLFNNPIKVYNQRLRMSISYIIGVVSAYWFVQRVSALI